MPVKARTAIDGKLDQAVHQFLEKHAVVWRDPLLIPRFSSPDFHPQILTPRILPPDFQLHPQIRIYYLTGSAANLAKLNCGSLPAEMRENSILLATPTLALISMHN